MYLTIIYPPMHTHEQIEHFLELMVRVLWVGRFRFSMTERSLRSVSVILMTMLRVNLPLLAMCSCSAAQWSPLAHPLQRRSPSWMMMVRKVKRLTFCSQSQTHRKPSTFSCNRQSYLHLYFLRCVWMGGGWESFADLCTSTVIINSH